MEVIDITKKEMIDEKFMMISKDWFWISKKSVLDKPLLQTYGIDAMLILFLITSRVDIHKESRFTLMEIEYYFNVRREAAKEKLKILDQMEADGLLVKKEYIPNHFLIENISELLFPKKSFIILKQSEVRKIFSVKSKRQNLFAVFLLVRFFLDDKTKEAKVSMRTIESMSSLSRKTVAKDIGRLEELGLIQRRRTGWDKQTGKNNVNVYTICEQEDNKGSP